MDIMEDTILKYFKKHKRFITKEKLKQRLEIKGEKQTTYFLQALNTLVENGSLFFDIKKGYCLFENKLGYAFGSLEVNKTGNGFIHTKDNYIIMIKKEDLNGALNGDNVIIGSIVPHTKKDYLGKVEKVVKRKTGNVICEVIGNGLSASLKSYNQNEQVPVYVHKNQLKDLVAGELVLVNVGVDKRGDQYEATIEKVIGHKSDVNIDLNLIYEEYDIPIDFNKKTLEEAKELPTEVREEEIVNRVDLRDKDIITIDCDNTKDRDDAVYVEKLDNGHYILYTSISHVSYYVKKDSDLYKEAKLRSTSHYPLNTCNPMFPPELSNGICSLNPNVDRLTRTCEIEFDEEGNVLDYHIYPSVINSRMAMKYSEVNKVLEGEVVEGYEPYVDSLQIMSELCDLLERKREERNYLDFDIPDLEVVQSKTGEIEKIVELTSGKAEKIIENFMLITGTTVAEHYSWLPFIYRVHESPNPETVTNVIKILRTSGIKIPKYSNIDEMTLKEVLDKVNTKDEARLIREMLLKSMKRARYDVYNVGHFALQLPKYCHFTSPIRRFPDFSIHMLLDEIEKLDYSPDSIGMLEKELFDIANHASNMEKKAQEVEQDALKMAMAQYMEKHIGEGYDAVITDVYPRGIFVRTNELISGKVRFDSIPGDRYYYNSKENAVVGKKHKKKYKIGNKVYVVVKDASKVNRTVDFAISNSRVLRKEKSK